MEIYQKDLAQLNRYLMKLEIHPLTLALTRTLALTLMKKAMLQLLVMMLYSYTASINGLYTAY